MGVVIELPYRRVRPHIVQKLVRAGYLPSSRRHDMAAVLRAWKDFRRDANRWIGDRNDPSGPNLA
jgi:hypothetical protein